MLGVEGENNQAKLSNIVYCYALDFIFTNLEFQEIYQPLMKHYLLFKLCVYLKKIGKKNRNYINTMKTGVVYDISRYNYIALKHVHEYYVCYVCYLLALHMRMPCFYFVLCDVHC